MIILTIFYPLTFFLYHIFIYVGSGGGGDGGSDSGGDVFIC